jgi:hypothetical protein
VNSKTEGPQIKKAKAPRLAKKERPGRNWIASDLCDNEPRFLVGRTSLGMTKDGGLRVSVVADCRDTREYAIGLLQMAPFEKTAIVLVAFFSR